MSYDVSDCRSDSIVGDGGSIGEVLSQNNILEQEISVACDITYLGSNNFGNQITAALEILIESKKNEIPISSSISIRFATHDIAS